MNRELSQESPVRRSWILRVLLARWFPWVAIGVAIILVAPSLWNGWATDDYYERWLLSGSPKFPELGYPQIDMCQSECRAGSMPKYLHQRSNA